MPVETIPTMPRKVTASPVKLRVSGIFKKRVDFVANGVNIVRVLFIIIQTMTNQIVDHVPFRIGEELFDGVRH
jgi:hypothetical protein